jgi:hypothetical protein
LQTIISEANKEEYIKCIAAKNLGGRCETCNRASNTATVPYKVICKLKRNKEVNKLAICNNFEAKK